MATTQTDIKPDKPPDDPLQQSDAVVAEVVDAMLEPDRAHHDEIGRTRNGTKEAEPAGSPREQPAAPIDIEEIGE